MPPRPQVDQYPQIDVSSVRPGDVIKYYGPLIHGNTTTTSTGLVVGNSVDPELLSDTVMARFDAKTKHGVIGDNTGRRVIHIVTTTGVLESITYVGRYPLWLLYRPG